MASNQTEQRQQDPRAALDLLSKSRSFTAADYFLDFGPTWYAPALSLAIGGFTLAGADLGRASQLAALLVGTAAVTIVAIHDHRRRRAHIQPSLRSLAMFAGITIICWALVATWGTALSSIGVDRFVPWGAFIAWTATTLALLGVRSIFRHYRQRRTITR